MSQRDTDSQTSEFTWRRYGETGALLEFVDSEAAIVAYRSLRVAAEFDECVPGATTIYVEKSATSPSDLAAAAQRLVHEGSHRETSATQIRTHTIDVRYDGVDLSDVAALTGFTVDEVVELHSTGVYTVSFLGFSRGFAYLAGLDPRIVVPRLASPRTSVPSGSVAMGAGYTGIYPMSSPGGWRLLGTTEATLFDPASDPPNVLSPGDQVRFHAV